MVLCGKLASISCLSFELIGASVFMEMCRSHSSWVFFHITDIWACWDVNGKRPHVAIYCLCVVQLCFFVVPVCFHCISSMREPMFYCRIPNWSLRVSCLETYILPRDSSLRHGWLVHSWEPLHQWDSSKNPQSNPTFFMAF